MVVICLHDSSSPSTRYIVPPGSHIYCASDARPHIDRVVADTARHIIAQSPFLLHLSSTRRGKIPGLCRPCTPLSNEELDCLRIFRQQLERVNQWPSESSRFENASKTLGLDCHHRRGTSPARGPEMMDALLCQASHLPENGLVEAARCLFSARTTSFAPNAEQLRPGETQRVQAPQSQW